MTIKKKNKIWRWMSLEYKNLVPRIIEWGNELKHRKAWLTRCDQAYPIPIRQSESKQYPSIVQLTESSKIVDYNLHLPFLLGLVPEFYQEFSSILGLGIRLRGSASCRYTTRSLFGQYFEAEASWGERSPGWPCWGYPHPQTQVWWPWALRSYPCPQS